MRPEELWLAIGEVNENYIIEADRGERASHKRLAVELYELGGRQYYLDSYCVEDGLLYVTVCARCSDPQSTTEPLPVLFYKESREEIKPTYGPLSFMDENGFLYWSFAYETEKPLDTFCYYSAGLPTVEKVLDLHRTFEFSAVASLESQTLPCAVPGMEIECSPFSLSITGDVPEMEFLQIFLADGSEPELFQYNPERILFSEPVEPDKIVSILPNGKELLF